MTISRNEKLQNASDIYEMILKCKTEDELERVSDYLDESLLAGYIFKKAYKFLSEELDGQISYLVGEGLI
jgi:hypothetical protein